MYAVITKPGIGLPTVINQNSGYFPDFIMGGYIILYEGTKKECNDLEEEILIELYGNNCINLN